MVSRTLLRVLRLSLLPGLLVCCWIGANSLAAQAPEPGRGDTARQVLAESGVRGGLVVHLGCGDGRLTAALRAGDSYLVHGLDADAANVAAARKNIQALGLYGPVSVDTFDGKHLPYVDNLVNLLVAEDLGGVSIQEVMRVLAPRGVVCTKRGRTWENRVKPWPGDIDEWTHWLHDAGNSGVARDARAGPPRHMQWVAGPLWTRGHEVISSIGAAVTAQGRIFYALDEGQTAVYSLPSKWMLVARDAFSGVLLWKRPLPYWGPPVSPGGFTSGFRPQRLATDGRRVYLPMGQGAVLTARDAATGKTLKTLDAARGTGAILCDGGVLVAVLRPTRDAKGERRGQASRASLIAARSDTLDVLWTTAVAPQAVALASGRVFYCAGGQVVALDARTGAEAWRAPFETPMAKGKRRAPAPTLKVHEGTVYVQCGSRLAALSAADGKPLWERKDAPVSKGELFAAAGLLWRPQGSTLFGYDPATGEVRKTVDASDVFTPGHHPRCYPSKATERYVITNNRGAEFVSLGSGRNVENDWLRGVCAYGILPANGLLYVPPNPCFCYPGVKITGFNALAAAKDGEGEKSSGEQAPRLERGPAYTRLPSPVGGRGAGGEGTSRLPAAAPTSSPHPTATDWPTYRHDAARTGAATCDVPPNLKTRWTADAGGPLTPPVVCEGRLYVAAKGRHTLLAMGADDGRPLWQFTAGGRIDSPPSVLGQRVLFGCADGRVYCLRASDGELAWRFQAAPSPQRIVAFGQLESPWRVHGSVLIHDGLVYCTAGRSSYLDGGLRVFALEPASGRVVYQTRLDTWTPTREDARGKPFVPAYHIEGAKSDVLVSQGGFIYLGQVKFDGKLRWQPVPYVLPNPKHESAGMDLDGRPFVAANETAEDYEEHQRQWIERTQTGLVARLRQQFGSFNYGVRRMGLHVLATGGMLDDSWFNRTYWTYSAAWPGFYIAHRAARTGQLLVVGPEKTYAVQAFPSRNLQSPLFTPGKQGYLLAADANDSQPVLDDRTVEVTKGWGFTRSKPPAWFHWVPVRIRAMTLAGKTLFVAGPPDVVPADDPCASFEGRLGAKLWAVSAADGAKLAEVDLKFPPVFDGLCAAGGRLYLCTTAGQVLCFGEAKE